MTAAETPKVIGHGIEIIPVGGQLRPWVFGRYRVWAIQYAFVDTRRERGRHIVSQVQCLHGKIDKGINLIRPPAFERKSLQVDDENRRETGQ
jgi:hypothetical protein